MAVLAALLSTTAPTLAQDPAAPTAAPEAPASPLAPAPTEANLDSVIATVGGVPITQRDLRFAAEQFADRLGSLPPEQRVVNLVSYLIDTKLMAAAARAEQIPASDAFRQQLAYEEDRVLREQYAEAHIAAEVSDEKVKAAYDSFVAGLGQQEEIRARHILVNTEDEAKQIKAAVDGGAVFEEQATAHSIDGSRDSGGDLGFFTRGMMVAPFETAAFALEVGQVSEPVQSQFGWHLIKLEERRPAVPPSLEQMTPELQQQLYIDAYTRVTGGLKETTEVVVSDPAIAAMLGYGAPPAPAAPAEQTPPTAPTEPAPAAPTPDATAPPAAPAPVTTEPAPATPAPPSP